MGLERCCGWAVHANQSMADAAIAVPLNADAIAVLRRLEGRREDYVFTYRGKPVWKGEYDSLPVCNGTGRVDGFPLARPAAHLGVVACLGGYAFQCPAGDGRLAVRGDGAALCATVRAAPAAARSANRGGLRRF